VGPGPLAQRLARYSVNNQLLIALARPDASYVCGFRSWLQLGYQVRKGEKAIWILAPMPLKNREDTAETDAKTSQGEKPRVLFRAVPVFDRAQVDAIDGANPAPLQPPREPLTGDSHRHLIKPLLAFAHTLGYEVSFPTIAGSTGGWCDHDGKRIAVDAAQPVNGQVRILAHELAHALGVRYQEYGRRKAEVIVDTVVFSPCQGREA
jgi:hypothetical protein